MNESNVMTNSLKAWFLAARPKTLTGAAVPVMIGIASAISQYGDAVRVGAAVLCMLFALVMQIDANFVNDYFDFMKGSDDEKRTKSCIGRPVPAGRQCGAPRCLPVCRKPRKGRCAAHSVGTFRGWADHGSAPCG